jgi:hypothetical protein
MPKSEKPSWRPPGKRLEGKPSRAARTKSEIVLILTFAGATILFASWIAQNYYQAKWADERIYLEKTQSLVEMEQGNASMWQIQLNLEGAKQPRNDGLLAVAAYNLILSLTKLIAWEESRVSGGAQRPIEVKNFSHDVARRLLEKGDVEGLLNQLKLVNQAKQKFQKDLDAQYSEQMDRARQRMEEWNKRFLSLYVIGSLLLGMRYILTSVCRWPDKLVVEVPANVET